MLLLCLSLVNNECGDNIQVRLLLGFELLRHGDVPIQAGLAGHLAYERLERGGMVEDLQLVPPDLNDGRGRLLNRGPIGAGLVAGTADASMVVGTAASVFLGLLALIAAQNPARRLLRA